MPAFSAQAQVAVLTQNNDNSRSGANTAESTLTPATVSGGTFGKLMTITGLDANVNGQVLYEPDVAINGAAHNVLYAYTSNNTDNSPCSVWAFDADTGATLWHTALPNSATYTTATPVIDPASGTMFVLTKTGTDDTGLTYLRAFDITTGAQKASVEVHATALGTGDGSYLNPAGQHVVAFDGPSGETDSHGNVLRFHANDRAGLLLLNGVVYAAFAHNSDSNPYHGWLLGYSFDGSNFVQRYVFCTTPNGSVTNTPGGADGGIWMAGKGLTADNAGNIYFSVGNGSFDANTGGSDYGMCYLKLSPKLTVEDWYAPYDEASQSSADLDLGNTGLVGIPGTTKLFAGATKFGAGFLLASTGLGHFPASAQQETAVQRLNGLSENDDVGQNPIAWYTGSYAYVYLWPGGQNVEQFRYDPSVGNFNPPTPPTHTSAFPAGLYKQSSGYTAGGSLAVSSSAGDRAILWAVGNDGTLSAFDATDVSKPPLWSGSVGSIGHFQFPTVANGKVYVPTGSASIAVYGLTSAPAPALPVFRLYNSLSNDHFYTVNGAEDIAATEYSYTLEGLIGYAPAFSTSGAAPVYRLYDPVTGEHFFTNNPSERDYVSSNLGYRYEGVGFDVLTACGASELPLYRLYSPAAGRHFYTTSQAEHDYVITALGYVDEGILGYLNAP